MNQEFPSIGLEPVYGDYHAVACLAMRLLHGDVQFPPKRLKHWFQGPSFFARDLPLQQSALDISLGNSVHLDLSRHGPEECSGLETRLRQ